MKLSEHFSAIDALLTRHEPLWLESVWANPSPSWSARYPKLYDFLCSVEPTTVTSHQLPLLFNEELDGLELINSLTHVDQSNAYQDDLPNRYFDGIKGRKTNQIKSLLSILNPKLPIFEWCCGKAHLARIHGRANSLSGIGLEIDEHLVEQGQALANKQGVALALSRGDALATTQKLPLDHQVVALHACGDLHTHLLARCADERPRQVTVAPCCYHRTDKERYIPTSTLGLQSALQLNRTTLRLICEETTHATLREQAFTETNQLWRLAFHEITQRLGLSGYINTPSIGQRDLKQGFRHFVDSQLERLSIVHRLSDAELDHALRQGKEQRQRYEQLSLIRHLFRRPLELWIVLDQALRLEEVGYDVQLSTFCSQNIAARNLLIQARHS